MADGVVLPPGYKADARLAITIMSVIGEVLQGKVPPLDFHSQYTSVSIKFVCSLVFLSFFCF